MNMYMTVSTHLYIILFVCVRVPTNLVLHECKERRDDDDDAPAVTLQQFVKHPGSDAQHADLPLPVGRATKTSFPRTKAVTACLCSLRKVEKAQFLVDTIQAALISTSSRSAMT